MRKNAYDTIIKPNFDFIKKSLENGATEKQIYEALGISADCFYRYKKSKDELYELIKKGRSKLVSDLRGALVKRALGFEYSETKAYKKKEGGKEVEYIEKYTKMALPDVAALNLCLKNYDRDNWANDPQMLDIKKEELEIKKKLAEANDW